jgi:hypothetical protein
MDPIVPPTTPIISHALSATTTEPIGTPIKPVASAGPGTPVNTSSKKAYSYHPTLQLTFLAASLEKLVMPRNSPIWVYNPYKEQLQ